MGTIRDIVTTSLSDSVLPLARRTLEDVVYEILDERKVPSREEFRELQVSANELQGRVNRLSDQMGKLAAQLEQIKSQLDSQS